MPSIKPKTFKLIQAMKLMNSGRDRKKLARTLKMGRAAAGSAGLRKGIRKTYG